MAPIEMSVAVAAVILHAAQRRGVNPEQLAKAAGFDLTLLKDPDARISLALEEQLWNEAERLCEDPAIGLHAAQALEPGAFDVMDYVIRTAPSLREALQRLVRYNRIVHDVAYFRVQELSEVLRIEHGFQRAQGAQCRHSAEFTLASVIVFGTQLSGHALRARAVELAHPAPTDPHALQELEGVFGVVPRFAQRVNALDFDPEAFDLPILNADPKLSLVIERNAQALLAQLPQHTEGLTDRVRRVLVRSLSDGEVVLAQVAKSLHMSERSLQRKLAQENIRFEALLDNVRHELALRYLRDPKIAVAEVAYLLGYSEPSPFHRAFKRWTGTTPRELRQRGAGELT